MCFTWLELTNHSEYQEKARKIIEIAIEKYGLTYEGFNEMKYLDQCIAEGVRLHPPVPSIDRYTREIYKVEIFFSLITKKNLLASLAHSHRALRAPTYMNFALRAQCCALHSA